jgi:O-antigen/teichoic acid export membrane protein
MIINKKVVSLNVFFSIFQIVTTGIVYYFLYKFLLNSLGAELMGVWAIVLSISSTANIANLGIGSGVIRYTALFKVNNEYEKINRLLHTSLILLASFFLLIITIIYLIAPVWLHLVVKDFYFKEAMLILPYSLLCLLLNALSGIYGACLDGLQKNYIKSTIFVLSFILLIVLSYWLVPTYGLLGIAYAQLGQALFLFVLMVSGLKLSFPQHQLFALRWDKAIFKKIFSFGIKEQIISICQLCFDPLTKSLLGSLGELSLVSYYEMANRLVLQLRGLLVNANQVLIPIFTSAQEKSEEANRNLYLKVFSLNFLMSILWLSFIISTVIPISLLWIGSLNPAFVFMTVSLAFAYFSNIIISPAYFSNMGSAKLTNNVIGNVIIAVLNILLCYLLGTYFTSYGVVLGWSAALAIGSTYILAAYHNTNEMGFYTIFKKHDLYLTIMCAAYALVCYLLFTYYVTTDVWWMLLILAGLFAMIILIVSKVHPTAHMLVNMIKQKAKIK